MALQFASEQVKNNKDIVIAAVNNTGCAIECASRQLKGDKDVAIAAVSKYGRALKYTLEQFKNDKDVVIAAVSNRGSAIRFASKQMQSSKEVMTIAVNKWGRAIQYASQPLKSNKDVAIAVVSNSGCALEFVSDLLKKSEDVVIATVNNNGCAIQYASDQVKDNKEIVLTAVYNDGHAIQFASEQLKNDKELVIAAVTRSADAIRFASRELQNDVDVIVAALDGIDGEDKSFPRALLDIMHHDTKEKICAFQDMVRNGLLHHLDQDDECALSTYLDEKLILRSFLQHILQSGLFVCCTIEKNKHCRRRNHDLFLAPAIVERIETYTGEPTEDELQLIKEDILPIACVCARRTERTWAVLLWDDDDSEDTTWLPKPVSMKETKRTLHHFFKRTQEKLSK